MRMIGKFCALECPTRIITLIALVLSCSVSSEQTEIAQARRRIQDQIVLSRSIFVVTAGETTTTTTAMRRQKDLPSDHEIPSAPDTVQLLDAHAGTTLAIQFDDRPETSGQLESLPPDGVDPAQNVTSLLQTIKNQTNQTSAGSTGDIAPVERLDRDFISLFDELWLIKNTSVAALVQLQFFDNQTLAARANNATHSLGRPRSRKPQRNDKIATPMSPANSNTNTNNQVDNQQQSMLAHLNGKLAMSSKQDSLARRKLAEAAGRVSGWLSLAQQRLVHARDKLSQVVRGKLLGAKTGANKWPRQRDHPQDSQLAGGGGGEANALGDLEGDGPDANRRRRRRKRDTPPECNRLTIDEENTCREKELLINANLNISFPGTARAIEDNCQHITQLLANCWPAQLAQLKQSLAPWSDNLLATAATAAPSPDSTGTNSEPDKTLASNTTTSLFVENSCGLERPNSPQYIRDRVSWMWLNLCIDKRFRQDYIDNLRCLSTWSQEKAQQACNHDYRRMQTYLAGQAGHGFEWTSTSRQLGGGNKTSGGDHHSPQPPTRLSQLDGSSESQVEERPTATITVGGGGNPAGATSVSGDTLAASSRQLMSESELVVREVNSKLLCCMFDQFLRCVYRQAVRDCNRRGAQFVVNFLSRIGTDDMKHLCNSESRANVAASGSGASRPSRPASAGVGISSGGGGKKVSSTVAVTSTQLAPDRSPFIESNYCSEPRIQAALANNGPDGGRSGGIGGSSAPTPPGVGSGIAKSQANQNGVGSRPKNQRPGSSHLSHDPTYFGTYTMPSSAPAPSYMMSAGDKIGMAARVLFATTLVIFMSLFTTTTVCEH